MSSSTAKDVDPQRLRASGKSSRRLHPGIALVVLLLGLSAPGCADPDRFPSSLAIEKALRGAEPVYWSVENPDTGGSLHLLGSIHIGPEQGWLLPDGILRDLDRAEALVVEIDTRTIDPETMDDLVLEYALLPVNESLQDRIPPQLYAALRTRLEADELVIMGLDRLKPWMIAISLQAMEMGRLGYDGESGLDLTLLERVGEGKQVIPLETARDQIAMLDAMSRSAQASMLEEVLAQSSEMETYLKDLIGAWRVGDGPQLEKLLLQATRDGPEQEAVYQALIYDRNDTMTTRLVEMLSTDRNSFVVVGAAHLVGERGIPEQLRTAGLRVLRVRHAPSQGE